MNIRFHELEPVAKPGFDGRCEPADSSASESLLGSVVMRVHVLQHVDFEGLAAIEQWLERKEASVTFTRFFENSVLPPLEDIDFVIALGGPMSVNDVEQLPWLSDEKAFVARAIARGKSVLGICLGAQLIASSCGARVYAGPQKEIGWFPVRAVPCTPAVFPFPEQTDVLHWHGETFDLPAHAILLASSDIYPHQAFQLGDRVLGLQFHLEMTEESLARIVDGCREELVVGPSVQSESQLAQGARLGCPSTHPLLFSVLDYLTRPVRNS